MIRIQGLHKFFNKGRQNEIHVINNVNLDLPEKGMVAIFGKSGCGKTTLLNVIGGLDRFSEGTLTIENQSIRANTDVIRNRYIGYIFQNYNLNKAESCFDNVADALRLCGMRNEEEIEARVTAALTNVGMEKYAKRTPDTLSGGQQQRIAIARAIVKNPRIILADEPTGNLDEANTVMIMDLLKAIAKDHLVLLVTHEANLVDFYCDTVIKLQDGCVVDVKQNNTANGFAARDKNDIYLGELSHRKTSDENTEIEYYGEKPETPIKLKIVNNGGKIYVQIGTQKVQILDEFSEVKLKEGVYEEQQHETAGGSDIDMSALPPIQGSSFGRLFSLKSSIKSGYVSNFKNRKKGKKLLRRCMCLFASVIVFMSAVFGSVIGDIADVRASYNHNVFYLYTPDAEVSAKLNAAVGNADTAVDFIRITGTYPDGDETVYFNTATFETFAQDDYSSGLRTNAVYLGVSLAKDLKPVAGKGTDIKNDEILITTRVADALLEKSTLGYIKEYRDLIGIVCSRLMVDGRYLRIAGVVESNESAIYLSEMALAKRAGISSAIQVGSEYGIAVAEGEAVVLLYSRYQNVEIPQVGQTVQIHGKSVKIAAIKEHCTDYLLWLEMNGIQKTEEAEFFTALTKEAYPELVQGSEAFVTAFEKTYQMRYYEYYDYLYAEAEAFLQERYFFDPSMIELWLYLEKGIEMAKYRFINIEYYYAQAYKAMLGQYPTQEQLRENMHLLPNYDDALLVYISQYEEEFYRQGKYYGGQNSYLVSDADYVSFSKQIGNTDPLQPAGENIYYDKMAADGDQSITVAEVMQEDIYIGTVMDYNKTYYTVIHSTDPEKTEAWLQSEFSDLSAPVSYQIPLITPQMLFDDLIEFYLEDIARGLITLAVVFILMSVCMYFIMRSSLMNRIKEVGIYRAIGVSKKNLIFKFFVEAIVLTVMTVFVGYLLSSVFIYVCFGMSSLVESIFYYPLWLAGVDLLILCAVSLFFGTLPVVGLLRRTPSEILAKYDI